MQRSADAAPGAAARRTLARMRRLSEVVVAAAPYGAVAAFTLVVFWPLCIGRTLYWGDVALYFQPMLQYARHELRHGLLPLWNPYILGGQPFLGNPQMALFYPSWLLAGVVDPWTFLGLNTMAHVFLCGSFMYIFLARWTRTRTAALAGALVYCGSACLLGRAQFPPMLQTAAWFPLLLAATDRYVDRASAARLAAIGLVAALTVLAGHAQFAYLALTCSTAYLFARLWNRARHESGAEPTRDRAWRVARSAAPALVVGLAGLALTAAQTLPALQLLHESTRSRMTVSQANRFVLRPDHLVTLLAPRFFGDPSTADYWGGGNAWEPALFIGWAPLVLIAGTVRRLGRRRAVRFWWCMGLVGIWLAMGTNGGLFWLAFRIVPGIADFHDPARFLLVTTVSFAVLTALGADSVLTARAPGPAWSFGLTAAIAIPLVWYGQAWNPTAPRQEGAAVTTDATRLLRERVYSPRADIAWYRFVNYSDYGAGARATLAELRRSHTPNVGMNAGIEEASGYEPVPVDGPTERDGLARRALLRDEPTLPRLMALLGARTLLLPPGVSVVDPRLKTESRHGPVRAWRNEYRLPQAWLTRRTRRIDRWPSLLAALAAQNFDPGKTAIVSGRGERVPALGWGVSGAYDAPTLPVSLIRASVTRATMSVNAGPAPAILVYSATAYPGWRATVDGHRAPVLDVDGGLIGMYVRPGRHTVQFQFAPAVFRVGLYMSLLTVSAACSVWVALVRPRGHGRAPALDRG